MGVNQSILRSAAKTNRGEGIVCASCDIKILYNYHIALLRLILYRTKREMGGNKRRVFTDSEIILALGFCFRIVFLFW